jgi:hypothetical protein
MNEKIIQFPGVQKPEEKPPMVIKNGNGEEITLNEDQHKALNIILSNTSFIMIGIVPTPTGGDFYTSISGDADVLRNAKDSLFDVIDRAYGRKGI